MFGLYRNITGTPVPVSSCLLDASGALLSPFILILLGTLIMLKAGTLAFLLHHRR